MDLEGLRREAERRVVPDSLSLKCDSCSTRTAVYTLRVDGKKRGNFCSECCGVRAKIEVDELVKKAQEKK